MSNAFAIRPFGSLSWIIERVPPACGFHLIGCLSTEDRCLSASEVLIGKGGATSYSFLSIPPTISPSTLDNEESHRIWSLRRQSVESTFKTSASLVEMTSIHDGDGTIINTAYTLAEKCSGTVVLDVSTMPKRYFFPILTCLHRRPEIQNLIVTNTTPCQYGSVLSGDQDSWSPLPMYNGDPLDVGEDTAVVVAVGYQTLSVRDLIEKYRVSRGKMKLVLPFPSLHPGFLHNWKFIDNLIGEEFSGNSDEHGSRVVIERVPINDVSVTFDRLRKLTKGGRVSHLVLAPYGPKSVSVAMCLLGIARQSHGVDELTGREVFPTEIGYSQPRWYRHDYTVGVRQVNGEPDVTAFCVRLGGVDLYRIT